MPTIHAWQHIYSNVEKEQSPHGRGGFQTLFYTTAGLTEAEVTEMEGRLLYFPSTVEPVKRLFFTTSTGQGVVAQIVPLPDPDQFGRKGRYLAHSLVFTPEGLAQFEADPFRVFRRFSFITTIADALAQGDFRTGTISAVTLDLPAEPAREVEAARRWAVPELTKLALLALQAGQQTHDREAITVAGEPPQIESALAAAFLAVPTPIRPRCTFDTYFYRCNLVATYFWAIGLPELPLSVKFALIEGPSRQVQVTTPTQPETAYERWVITAIETQQLDQIVRQRNHAFALGEWLEGRDFEAALLEAASPELITAIFKVNPEVVQASLRRRVGEQLPAALAHRAAEYLYQQTKEVPLYRQLRQGFELAQLVETLYESYATQKFQQPAREETKALEAVLEEANHKLLRLILAYWRNPGKELLPALDSVDEPTYRQFVEIALPLGLVKPFSLLRPGQGDAFLDPYLAAGVDDWVGLTEALLEVKETACLSRLAGNVSKLPAKELKRLAKLISDQPDTPKSFQLAVDQAIAALPAEGGFKGMLRAVWHRWPGRK